MNLVIATIPDNATDLAGWLDRQLVGPDLAALVAELQAVHGAPSQSLDLAALVDPVRDALLHRGLEVLPRTTLTKLLTHPDLLLELQEMVLIEGGPYWQELTRESFPPTFLEPMQSEAPPRRGNWLRETLLALTTAAALLVAVFLWNRPLGVREATLPPVASTGWGWDKSDARLDELPAAELFDKLASGAGDWTKKRPESAADVAKRLGELRRGCTGLILAAHPNLTEPDRKWLKARCRVWGMTIGDAMVDLEAGSDPVKVRGGIDKLMEEAATDLSERARQVRRNG